MNFFFIKDRATQFLKRFYKRYTIAHKNLTHSIIPEPYMYKQDSTAIHELKKLIVHADYLSVVQKVFPECATGENVNMRIMQSSDLVRLHEYKIIVAEHITIIYSDEASLYYALLDLKTVLDQRIIHHTEIHNFAKHAWRGMHIDVARHYMPLSFLYELIDEMATLKLNYLHFHMSDDQGFRFESKVFPELHKKGKSEASDSSREAILPFCARICR